MNKSLKNRRYYLQNSISLKNRQRERYAEQRKFLKELKENMDESNVEKLKRLFGI